MRLSVPEGWLTVPLKRVAEEVRYREERVDTELSYLGMENVESWTGRVVGDLTGADITGTCLRFDRGDVLFGKLRPYLAKVLWATGPGHASTEFVGLRTSDELDSRFLQYVLRTEPIVHWLSGLTYGARMPRVSPSDIFGLPIPLPSRRIQAAVVDFLDRETTHIDRLIEKKERLIALLEEKRSALITRAVTKGIDPDVPMKDSGVEWIGEIPEHWEILGLRWHIFVRSGQYLPNTEFELAEDELHSIPVIGGNGVMGYGTRGSVGGRCIAVGRVGALCGNVHVVEPPAWITDNALQIAVEGELHLDYLALLLRSMDLNRWASQNAQPLITGSFIKEQRICRPPEEEQVSITAQVDAWNSGVGATLERLRSSISLLRERRSAIITAAVTGQIDVEDYEAIHRAPLAVGEDQPPASTLEAARPATTRETEESLQ